MAANIETETTVGLYSSEKALEAEARVGTYVSGPVFLKDLIASGGQFATITNVTDIKTEAIVSDTGEVLSRDPSSAPSSQSLLRAKMWKSNFCVQNPFRSK